MDTDYLVAPVAPAADARRPATTAKASAHPRSSPAVARFTADYVRLHARRRPHAPALVMDGQAISYRELDRDLCAATHVVAGLDLRPGSLVAVGMDDMRAQLLLMLALETLGHVAAGFRADEDAGCADLLARADLTLAQADSTLARRKAATLTPDWLEVARTRSPGRPPTAPAPPENAGFMVVRSSGTTGRSKLMQITRAMEHARLRDRVRALRIGRDTRYLATMQLGVGLIYTTVVSTLRVGGRVIGESVASAAEAIGLRHPNLVNLLPYQLARTLGEVDAMHAARRADLLVLVNGGKLDPALRAAALHRVCGRVLESYGSNECGLTAIVDPDGVARALPGIDIEVVDPLGAAVPTGSVGEIRVRGPSVVHAYLDDAAASARVFRNGCYNSGDLALRMAPGAMRVLGRPDDVINIGGIKLSAVDVERSVLDCAARHGLAARDAAVVATADAGSHPLLVICATGITAADAQCLAGHLRSVMQVRFSVACIDAIPRTEGGKVRRGDLRRTVDAALSPDQRAARDR